MYEKYFVAKQMKRERDGLNRITISFMELFTHKIYFGWSYQRRWQWWEMWKLRRNTNMYGEFDWKTKIKT